MTVTVTGAVTIDGIPVGLRAVDGRIAALGADVTPEPGDEVLDATGRALLPGFVNGHTHAAMTLFRGFAGDLPLMEWLEDHIWPAEARLDADDVYWGTRLACLEMIRTGTIRFWDMYWQPGAVARAVLDAGLRATVGLPLLDGLDPARGATMRADALRFLDELDAGPHVTPSLTPHSIYMVSADSLAWVAEQSAARDLAVHLHFLEIESEVTGCVERTGKRPGAYLHDLGLLTPRTILAHGVWMDDADLDLVAAGGSTVVTNPVSNLKLAVGGIFRHPDARRRGIPVGLGTDGASSNNGLDVAQDLKVFSLLQKHRANDTTAVPAEEAWRVATGGTAPFLRGVPDLTVGAPADFILVRLDAPELGPGHLLANLVYAASGHVVDATVVDGRVLMRDGVIDDDAEIRARARERAARLGVL